MKRNRVNLKLTFSAALAGLLLSLAPSAAHGHGNNPKNTSDTAPDTGGGGGGPPQFNPGPSPSGGGGETAAAGALLGPAELDAMTTSPEVIVFVGADVTLDNVFDASSQVLFDPATVGTDFLPADAVAPQVIVDAFGIVDGSGSSGGGVVLSSVIPAPGTLALLGLAAVAARRRRRRK